MVAAIAFESVVKLLAFLAVGVFVTYGMFGGLADLFQRAAAARTGAAAAGCDSSRAGTVVRADRCCPVLAIIFLPRQFQIIVVENVNERHLRAGRLAVSALSAADQRLRAADCVGRSAALRAGQGVDPDTFVLTLPLARGAEALALLVFIGGLSAATGMVIVETIALSTMVCNDLVMPSLLRSAGWASASAAICRGCCSASAAPPSW